MLTASGADPLDGEGVTVQLGAKIAKALAWHKRIAIDSKTERLNTRRTNSF
jgi:hypothetical protein